MYLQFVVLFIFILVFNLFSTASILVLDEERKKFDGILFELRQTEINKFKKTKELYTRKVCILFRIRIIGYRDFVCQPHAISKKKKYKQQFHEFLSLFFFHLTILALVNMLQYYAINANFFFLEGLFNVNICTTNSLSYTHFLLLAKVK